MAKKNVTKNVTGNTNLGYQTGTFLNWRNAARQEDGTHTFGSIYLI